MGDSSERSASFRRLLCEGLANLEIQLLNEHVQEVTLLQDEVEQLRGELEYLRDSRVAPREAALKRDEAASSSEQDDKNSSTVEPTSADPVAVFAPKVVSSRKSRGAFSA